MSWLLLGVAGPECEQNGRRGCPIVYLELHGRAHDLPRSTTPVLGLSEIVFNRMPDAAQDVRKCGRDNGVRMRLVGMIKTLNMDVVRSIMSGELLRCGRDPLACNFTAADHLGSSSLQA
jgi:hypothetical protein